MEGGAIPGGPDGRRTPNRHVNRPGGPLYSPGSVVASMPPSQSCVAQSAGSAATLIYSRFAHIELVCSRMRLQCPLTGAQNGDTDSPEADTARTLLHRSAGVRG